MIVHNFTNTFEKVFVLTLKRRQDRIDQFWSRLNKIGWPFKIPEPYYSVDHAFVPVPSGWNGQNHWKDGGGAWGCMQGHRHILEYCLMNQVESVLILEDDAWPVDEFIPKLQEFIPKIPDDWEGIMLGGQHHGRVDTLESGLVRTYNCQRTHAYAARGKYLRDMYSMLHSYFGHCDHAIGQFQSNYKIYAPDPFLIAQGKNQSDITGRLEPLRLWSGSDYKSEVFMFKCTRTLIENLWSHGVHTGYNRDHDSGVDKGLLEIYNDTGSRVNRIRSLRAWGELVRREATALPEGVCGIWIPNAMLETPKGREFEQLVERAFSTELSYFDIKDTDSFVNRKKLAQVRKATIVDAPNTDCVTCQGVI